MEESISSLLKLCENRRKGDEEFKLFQSHVEELTLENVEAMIVERLAFMNGPQVVNALLLGLSLKSQSQKKRMKMFEIIMAEVQKRDIPSRNASTILTWLVVELEKLSTSYLLKISDICVNYIGTSTNPNRCCWKDLLPKVLSLLVNKKEIEHYGSEKSGEEYKKQAIISLCQSKWNPAILTSLASMFIYVPLSSEEHQTVVSKLCHGLGGLSPSEIPPLVHQLLLLTKTQNSMILFFTLKEYYNKHIYGLEESLNVVDSTNLEALDAIEAVNRKEVVESQNVVLYHVEDSAKSTLGSTQELLKAAKSSVSAPETFLEPFLLSVLLSLSTLPMYEVQLMDTLKNTVIRAVLEDEKKSASDWLRKILTISCDVEQILIILIKSSSCEQESVVRGLVSLSMSLLKQSVGSRDVCHKVYTLGRMIAVNIVKRHHQVARTVLSTIADCIINRPELTQYTECLAEVCDTSPLLVVESCTGVITRLLGVLPDLPSATAYKVITAVISLTRVSSKLRDNLILVLKKSLFIHNEAVRKVAVFGFLQLLKRLKLKSLNALSQNSFQIYTCPSVLTQTCLDVHFPGNQQSGIVSGNNEGICLEVINILKRCFMQQASVKISLYQGMCKSLIHNPELCAPVTSLLLDHFSKFYETDEEAIPPLYFSKAVIMKNNEPVILEPLGQLLYALNQVIVTAKSLPCEDDDELFNNQIKLEKIVESLVKRFGKCEPKHFELDLEEMDTLKEEVLKEVLSVYQSIMIHMVIGWDASAGMDQARAFMSLYRSYHSFLDFAKNVKPKGREGGEGVKARGRPGVPPTLPLPPTLFDFDTIQKLLSLYLLEDVDWCMDDVRDEIRSKKPLLRFTLQCCFDLLTKSKNQLQEYRAKTVLDQVSQLAKLLFERCLQRFDEVMELDSLAAVSAVECLSEICTLVVTFFKSQLHKFLTVIIEGSSNLNNGLEKVIKVYLKVFAKVLDSEEDSQEETHFKKLSTSLVQGISVLSLELPVDETGISKVVNWLTEAARQRKVTNIPVAKSLVSLLLTLLLKSKSDSSLQDNLALHICEMFGTVNDVDVEKSAISLNIVSHDTKVAVVPLLISSLSSRLDSVDWLIVRLRAELSIMSPQPLSTSSPKTRKIEMKKREKELVGEAGLVVSCCQWLCTASLPPPLSEQVCKLLTRTYGTLTHLTKYFSLRASQQNPVYQEARFNKLVRLSASHLSSQMADFILYIEALDDDDEKKLSKKILNQAKKQTIYIPKLVAELENFTKCVTQLSNKCKDPSLTANMKLTTTRDFRLNTKRLEEVLKRRREEEETDIDEDSSCNINNISPVLKDSTQDNRGSSQTPVNTTQASSRGKASQTVKGSQASTKNNSQPANKNTQPRKRRKTAVKLKSKSK